MLIQKILINEELADHTAAANKFCARPKSGRDQLATSALRTSEYDQVSNHLPSHTHYHLVTKYSASCYSACPYATTMKNGHLHRKNCS